MLYPWPSAPARPRSAPPNVPTRSDRHAPGAIHYKANTMAAAMWRAQPNAPDLLSLSLSFSSLRYSNLGYKELTPSTVTGLARASAGARHAGAHIGMRIRRTRRQALRPQPCGRTSGSPHAGRQAGRWAGRLVGRCAGKQAGRPAGGQAGKQGPSGQVGWSSGPTNRSRPSPCWHSVPHRDENAARVPGRRRASILAAEPSCANRWSWAIWSRSLLRATVTMSADRIGRCVVIKALRAATAAASIAPCSASDATS